MSKSLLTFKANIAKGSQRLSKATVKNIVNAGEFEKIELAYSYDGREVHKGDLIENPVEWFNGEYDSLDVRLYKVEEGSAMVTLSIHSNLWYYLFIDLKKDYEPSTSHAKNNNSLEVNNTTKDYVDAMQAKFKNGEGTAEELRTYYIYLLENEEAVKEVILNKLNNSDKYKRKRKATKAELIKEVYNNLIEDLVYFVQDALSYTMDFSNITGSRKKAIENIINNATDEKIQAQFAKTKADREARAEQRKAIIESIKNPQTLEDFQNVKLYRKDKTLTPEEQERYDNLYSIAQIEKRAQQEQEKAEKALSVVNTSGQYTIIETVDTRDGSPLWVVKLNNRVGKDDFNYIRSQIMKPIDGYYSRFTGGFNFKYDPSTKLLGEQPEQQDEQVEEIPSKNSDKLRKVADNMQDTIDSKRADRLTNTARRARMAASAEQDADNMEFIQGILRNVANAMDSNELKFIGNIDSRAQIETLESILIRANIKKKDVENIEYRVWRENPITADCIKYAEIPSSKISLNRLQYIINDIKDSS